MGMEMGGKKKSSGLKQMFSFTSTHMFSLFSPFDHQSLHWRGQVATTSYKLMFIYGVCFPSTVSVNLLKMVSGRKFLLQYFLIKRLLGEILSALQ